MLSLHPLLDNRSAYAVELLVLADAAARPVLTVIVKVTLVLEAGRAPALAAEPEPVCVPGEHWGEPGRSSLRYEPQMAWFKPATDVVLLGHAQALEGPAKQIDVGLRVGPVTKVVRVFGDRAWTHAGGSVVVSGPVSFERIPLIWERAFGGRDPGGSPTAFEPRNPVGRGYVAPGRRLAEPQFMPNLEDPSNPLRAPGDTPAPAGFGFIAPHWQPRAGLAGTYDAAWQSGRAPALPVDFKPAFLNAAAPGLVAPGYLQGDEAVLIVNAGPAQRLAFNLPGLPPPTLHVDWRRYAPPELLRPVLDTVLIDTDAMRLLLTWRAHLVLPHRGIHAVAAVRVRSGT